MLKDEILGFLRKRPRSLEVVKRELGKMGYSEGDIVFVMGQLLEEGKVKRWRGRGLVYKVVEEEGNG